LLKAVFKIGKSQRNDFDKMIIFSQCRSAHSRLANSLIWMSKVHGLLNFTGQTCCFPWAIENFGNYLHDKSFWMMRNDADNLFRSCTKRELSAANLSSLARTIEHNYEVKNGLKAFDWDKLVTYSEKFQCLYICGNIDITDDKNIKLINDNEMVIIHEPFNLKYLDSELSSADYRNIVPKTELLEKQTQVVNSLSLGKRKIGLHIRRGDYERWQGGKYFFDDDFWFAKVKRLTDKDCAVYVFTNEKNLEFHNKLNNLGVHVSNEAFYIDFVKMMLMNEIYGPPSTFSVMAVNIAKRCFGYDSQFHYLPPKF
jgi:hypothetical protein